MTALLRSLRLLLLSTSTVFGGEYLHYARAEICDFLGPVRRVLFVPFALHDRAAYAMRVRACFAQFGYAIDSLHEAADQAQAVREAEAVFVGGGNTFRLLRDLHDLLPSLRDRVEEGMPYVGSSAGTNIAAPTIRTTNDMPIAEPVSFAALGLVPFQINPHYQDADLSSTHMGETREERIVQFLEENDTPVVGLREGALLRVEHGSCELRGRANARLFRRGVAPVELEIGSRLEAILA